ncbi:trypsin-like peptidase domain-containing protein [Streptomyces sp. NPDC005202]|uniref:trypsin-like peptidase domain-containing protein n=1 Tax=Streptomyces sp. NPDC005202 TaxID=3157021 RepID=UPI0033A87A47
MAGRSPRTTGIGRRMPDGAGKAHNTSRGTASADRETRDGRRTERQDTAAMAPPGERARETGMAGEAEEAYEAGDASEACELGEAGDASEACKVGEVSEARAGTRTGRHAVRAVRRRPEPADTARERATEARDRALDGSLVWIRDLAGRPRGTGFAADHHGTVITSHEAVDGLARLVLHAPGAGDRTCVVTADAVTELSALDLALIRTEGLGVDPLPVTVRDRIETGTYVRIAAGCWREARVLGAASATYTATDRFHLLEDVLELAIGTAGRDALRLGGGAAGGPVLDAATGAVVAVLGTALQSGHRDAGFAVPLRPTEGPLAELLARNAATVPAYGADLNLAGVLELTATSVDQDGPPGALPGATGPAQARGPAPVGSVGRAGVAGPAPVGSVGRAGVAGLGSVGSVGQAGAVDLRPVEAGGQAGGPGRRPVESGRPAAAPEPGPSAAVPELGRSAAVPELGRSAAVPELGRPVVPVERADVVRELTAFTESPSRVLALVGASGSGRTTELAALAARRTRGAAPAPTLGLRGADLSEADTSVADGARRALDRAARIVAASRSPLRADLTDLTPERLAHLARTTGRPLLLLLDGPEEMPPALAHRLPEWTEGTARWLRETGTRLVVACREGYWEEAGAQFPEELLHTPAAPDGTGHLPPCLRLGDLTPDEAREARSRHGLPEDALVDADARHPLTLRLLSEVHAALPEAPHHPCLDRYDVFSAYLDLMCLRIAVRLAAGNRLRGPAVRRLAAKVSGQVHEAARRSLGHGRGELDRASFEAVFPWGPAPARLGGATGWASAVLAEGLLVPAGDGYRFAHEELADWIQGTHLDLDEALRVLVHRHRTPGAPHHPVPAPHHRIGPVVQALLLLARQYGTRRLAVRLEELVCALDTDPHSWWAARLLAAVLLRVPDATPYAGVLRLLAELIVAWRQGDQPVPAGFGPPFWTALALPDADRYDLLRRLVLADGAPHDTGAPRYLDAAAQLLAADPAAVQPHLTRWFDDERPLPATPHATVATAAQALLHTHRHRAPDDLTEVLVDCAHRRADELLAVLAEEEPSALCRAVDRWAHDERPARRVAAVAYGLRAAPHVRTEADRELLRYAALALLARPADSTLHGGALALLVRDPHTRSRHFPQALRQFAAGDPSLPPSALVPALTTHPEAALAAFGDRLSRGTDAGEVLRTLADATTPALARRVVVLIGEAVAQRPETAGHVAAYVDRRLDQGPAARAVLFPLVTGLLGGGPEQVRAALAGVLAAPGTPASHPLRRELLDFLLVHEDDPAVLDAVLHSAGATADEDLRDLIHRTGLLLVRTPEGAAVFDRGLVELSRHVVGFAARMARWLTDDPQDWAAVVGPSARRMIENLAGARVPA